MKIAVLFDGAGLARLGLEQAGHECVGVELDPIRHHLSKMVGSGNCVLGDATQFPLSDEFDAVWASPPCAKRSTAPKDLTKRGGLRNAEYQQDLLQWCLDNQDFPLISWIENVSVWGGKHDRWGTTWNAAQFSKLQNRNRVIGGCYEFPKAKPYKRAFPGVCPCIMATEYKGCATDKTRASRFYGRKLTPQECAKHQGFKIPEGWWTVPSWYMPLAPWRNREVQWIRRIYEAIGDGVPVFMSKAFGKVYP